MPSVHHPVQRDGGGRRRPARGGDLGGPASPLRWVLPGPVLLAAVVGGVWGTVPRSRRPEVYRGIGATAMAPEDEVPPALPTLLRVPSPVPVGSFTSRPPARGGPGASDG